MNGNVTYYYGHALTGQGVKHLYEEMMDEAELVYILQGAPTFKGSELLKELGYFYVKQGFAVEWFKHALLEDIVEAVYVQGCNRLFVWSSGWGIEPIFLGTKHRVMSFYDCLEEIQLERVGEQLADAMTERESWREKCISKLNSAIKIHDDWEVVTQGCMNWQALNDQVENLKTDVFQSIVLNKTGIRTHRLLGTLTPRGAENTVDSITKNVSRRLMIKGKPGTGKSSLMKGLADEANSRGLDAQIIWCGLDSNSVDMVIIPELNFCIFDSTEPHIFEPQDGRLGDEIFDIGQHCAISQEAGVQIEDIRAKYKEAMQDAMGYSKRYAEAEYTVRRLLDNCISSSLWREKTAPLFERLTK
ncbi:nucleotide kinase [Lysinibacillus sp. NPDC058147]|uniref:nucleotide kinase n=1 Tax=unclassified Lysinibacillus TaxID=2636778 RepID=UPI0036DD77B7